MATNNNFKAAMIYTYWKEICVCVCVCVCVCGIHILEGENISWCVMLDAAKTCYDLIGHTPASLSMQHLGILESFIA